MKRRNSPLIWLTAAALTLFSGCNNQITEPAAAVGKDQPHEVLVAAPGLVEPVTEELKIGAEISGKIHTVLVDEGDRVRRGDVIAKLEDAEPSARLRSVEAQLQQRQAELQRLVDGARAEERQIAKSQLEETEAVLRNAQVERTRREQLFKDGDISREEFDRADRDYKVAVARHDQASQNFKLVDAQAREDDVAKAQAAVSVANGQVQEARAALEKTAIHSPINGVVLRRHLKAGEDVVPNMPIVTLGDTTSERVRVDVDEADIGKIQVGQRAFVSAEAYGDRKFLGHVTRISQILGKKRIRTEEPTERIDTKILETLIDLDEDYKLPMGLRVNAFIVISK